MDLTHPTFDDLPASRLDTYIDESRHFALYFLEGQRLIRDLALLHGTGEGGNRFAWFRDLVLGIQPLIAFLKGGEQLGFYIDSQQPYFRLKIETGHNGSTRCALVAEEIRGTPQTMTGMVRLLKLYPDNRPPYQSVLDVHGLPLWSIVNRVLEHSYQVNCEVIVSQASDQSLMLHQLPPLPGKESYDFSLEALHRRRLDIEAGAERLFGRALHDRGQIGEALGELGFRWLAGREVIFHCSCSRERMVHNIQLACRGDYEELFDPGQTALEIICEYCKSRYLVGRDELEGRSTAPN